MIIEHNVPLKKISWIKSNDDLNDLNKGGVKNLYIPESVEELSELCKQLYSEQIPFEVIGCASNTLIFPTYKIENLISLKNLNKFHETTDAIVCECGVLVNRLAKYCVNEGYIGYDGLVDLPGIVSSAIYGNAGCFGCALSTNLQYVEFIDNSGIIRNVYPEELDFQFRSSALKRKELKGIILRVYLRKQQGDKLQIQKASEKAHETRVKTQPSAANNLGSTAILGKTTIKGFLLMKWAGLCCRLNKKGDRISIILSILNLKELRPYLFNFSRYMFRDKQSFDLFSKYQELIHILYKDAKFEIEIRK